jgi:drug/metabolite transporter (DMT)-like permease
MSAFSFSIMAIFVKSTPHSVLIKAFSRQIISCLFVLIVLIINNYRIFPLKKNRIKLVFRCIFGSVGIYFYFYSIDNMILANASMLTRLSPFFVTIFAFIFLKEKVSIANWLVFIPMIIGCALIIKPNSVMFNPASIYAIISACSGALAYTMIKSIGEEESAYSIIFWFTLSSSMMYFIIAIDDFIILDNVQYFNLILIGIFGVLGQIGLTLSYQLSKASEVAPYSYFYIIFTGLFGFYIWGEIPERLSITGYFLIAVSFYYLNYYQKRK